jgi:hypothetical protein
MSKTYEIQEECPACKFPFEFTMFRTIWGELPENRELVMSDSVNVATCKACGLKITIVAPLFYTNSENMFAVWWEPNPDPQIDADRDLYALLGGANCYLANAPRIKDWIEFKDAILKFERGELKGGSPLFTPKANSCYEVGQVPE